MHPVVAATLALFLAQSAPSAGPTARTTTFKVRLTRVPVEPSTQASITGRGTAAATLAGTKLTIDGTFEGMQSAATTARVHIGGKGIRGAAEFDLTVSKATSGTILGTLTLTRVQIDSLRRGWFYIQINSENAPDGNLWGWLLP